MAVTATSVWSVFSTGNALNGAGFDPSQAGAGTDYSQQDSPQILVTDGSCAANTTLTSATAGFNSTHIGNYACLIVSGTVQGFWRITAVTNATTVTIDRNGPNSGAITIRLGGASKIDQNGLPFQSNSVSGNKVWVKGPGAGGGDYTLSVNPLLLDKANTNDLPYTVEGYTTTRGDNGRPTLTTAAASLDCLSITGSFNIVKNLNLNATGGAFRGANVTGNFNHFQNCVMQGVFPLRVAGYVNVFRLCEITGSGAGNSGVTIAGGVSANLFEGCAIHGNNTHGVDVGTNGPQMFINTAIYANGSSGINTPAGGQGGDYIFNCVIWNNGQDGIRVSSTVSANGGIAAVNVRRTVFGKNVGYDLNYTVEDVSTTPGALEWAKVALDCNFFYTTGTGRYHNLPANPNDVTLGVSPFTSDTNFTLNSTSNGGALITGGLCTSTIPDGNTSSSFAGISPSVAGTSGGQALINLWRELTNEKDSNVVPDATVYMYLDAAAERLNRRLGYHWTDDATTVVLVAGTQEYALPTDVEEIVFVEWNGKILQKADLELWRSREQDWRNQPQNFPREWTWYANKLVLLPAPNAAAVSAAASPVVRYVSTPRSLQTFGPEQLGTQDQKILVYGAVAMWSGSYPDSAVASSRLSYHEGLFEKEAEMVKQTYAERRVAR